MHLKLFDNHIRLVKKTKNRSTRQHFERQAISCKEHVLSHRRAVRHEAAGLLPRAAVHERPDLRGIWDIRPVFRDGKPPHSDTYAEHRRLDDGVPFGQGQPARGNRLRQPKILCALRPAVRRAGVREPAVRTFPAPQRIPRVPPADVRPGQPEPAAFEFRARI